VNEFNEWWPAEYTWSKDTLKEIRIDGRTGGLCTEIGPFGFRCDWGRVTKFVDNEIIEFKWQISPNREPIPNPEKAGEIRIQFLQDGDSVSLKLEHVNFENYGEGSDDYMKMMDSEHGWDFILDYFVKYCSCSTN